MSNAIQTETDDRGVTTLTLNVPQKHNALSADMIGDLTATAHDLGHDAGTRIVVLTGNGASFCAGGDLNWMREQMAGDDADRARAAKSIAMMLNALNTLPKPLIGRVQGNAFGGGVGLACVCDIAIADDSARFGLTETRLGLIPATIGPYVLARMGEAKARRIFMSSKVFGASEAVELGIVARAVPQTELDAAIEAEVTPYLSCAPEAVAAAKAHARHLGMLINEQVIDDSVAKLVSLWNSEAAAEGIAAFFEKRQPNWSKTAK